MQAELDSWTTAPAVTTGTNAGGFATSRGQAARSRGDDVLLRNPRLAVRHEGRIHRRKWTRACNLLGQEITATDPNSGTTSMSYDADGNLTAATDALHHTITYTYDPLSRKTGEYDGPSTASPESCPWTYDNSNPMRG